jgi:M6 family metalloprotease-like protein
MNAIRHILAVVACLFVFSAVHAVQMRRAPGMPAMDYTGTIDRDNPAIWEKADQQSITKGAAPGSYSTRDIIRTGTLEHLVVLVDFKDRHFYYQDTTRLKRHFNRIFNEKGYSDVPLSQYYNMPIFPNIGSVSDYFQAQSYGKYIPKFRIVGPIHASKSYAYYGKGNDAAAKELVREICDSLTANGKVDLMEYTNNGNLDNFFFIYAGRGENYYGADKNTLFPHADTVRNYNRIKNITYACSCELFWDTDTVMDGIGNICHEFAHTLGLPDFYNKNSDANSESVAAMGYWSLMDYGNYENQGFTPVGLTAFEKYSLGWMDIEEITDPGHYVLNDISQMPDADAGIHSAYRINTGQDDSFIILENHIRTGWYSYHATEGLMVTAVRYYRSSWTGNTINTSSTSANKRYHILPADNNYERDTNYGDLFPYQNVDSITTKGEPKLAVASNIPQYSVYNIRKEGGKIAFYVGPDRESKVEGHPATQLSINVIDGELSVTAPVGSRVSIHDISGRSVYETVTSQSTQRIALPGQGIWIVKCGNMVRKLRIEN